MAITSTNNETDLPEEIVIEILLKLPVKLLLKFKCVCKCWNTLIENPDFVTLHHGHEQNREHLLIWHRRWRGDYSHALSLDVKLCEYEETYCLRMPNAVCYLKGPVNGIYCVISGKGRTALWNPARKQFRPIPFTTVDNQRPKYLCEEAIGFGMDLSTGDYKVVWVRFKMYLNDLYNSSDVYVYNLRSNSWRHFKDEIVASIYVSYSHLHHKYLNGIYYFYGIPRKIGTGVILAFDMSSETFQEIKMPECVKTTGVFSTYGDSVALSCLESYNKFSVWVLEEGCWVKKYSPGPFSKDVIPSISLLGLWNNCEVLFHDRGFNLKMFNVNTNELRSVESSKKKCKIGHSFIDLMNSSYKESLFSLKGEGNTYGSFDVNCDIVKDFFEAP